jgi:hypothetical protein
MAAANLFPQPARFTILPPLYGKNVAVFLKDYFEEGRILSDELVEMNDRGIQLKSAFIPMHNVKLVFKLEHGTSDLYSFLRQCRRAASDPSAPIADTPKQPE